MTDTSETSLFPIRHTPYVPENSKVEVYSVMPHFGAVASPWEFRGWREEALSWYSGVGLHAGLNPTLTSVLTGPDVLRFFSDTSVNSFATFPVGSAKHVIMVNEAGNIMVHGLALRISEEAVSTMWLEPWLSYVLNREPGRYDVTVVDRTEDTFLYQIGGPRSLEVLEAASGDNLHDIRFAHHRETTIAGKTVRILRIGMAGTLSYEIHGELEDALPVYNALMAAGDDYDIKQMGLRAYLLAHTQNGFAQSGTHFPLAWTEDADFTEYVGGVDQSPYAARGSSSTTREEQHANPIEVGWRHMVSLKHDFIGKDAIEKIIADPKRTMVSFEWNEEDILDVHASQFTEDPYLPMDQPGHLEFWPPLAGTKGVDQTDASWADDVLDADGNVIGIATGRIFSAPFKKVLSLGLIDIEHASPDNELTVVWGDRGTRQKNIRVRVAPYPYLQENRNENVDVSTIPVGVRKV